MKKFMYLMMAVVSMSFIACGNKTNCPTEETDTTFVEDDSLFVIDSISVDTVFADTIAE